MVYVCEFILEWTYAKYNLPLYIWGGVTNSKVRGMSAGPIGTKFGTHVHIHLGMDIRQTHCPERQKGALGGGGLGGQTFKIQGKLSNGWADWHQLWFTSADSSGNGHRLNTSHPSIPQVACRGGGLGVTHSNSGEAVKRLDRLVPNLVHVCGFIWEWT